MGRKVGSFTNPETGQNDWIDLANISKLPLIPDQVTRFKDVRETLISYRFESDDANKMIQLFAEYSYNSERIVSQPQNIDEELFASQLAENVYSDNTIDNAPVVLEAKKKAKQEIGEYLLDRGALISDSEISGIGFICSDEARTITIEKMFVTAYQNGTADIMLIHCVGNANLKNIINPNIVFYTDNHKIVIRNYTVKSDSTDIIRNYCVTVSDVVIQPIDEKVEYEKMELNKDDEESLEKFLIARRSLLNDNSSDDEFDARFDDII